MDIYNQNLVVFFKTVGLDEKAMEQEVSCLNEVLRSVDTLCKFCEAHELVNRNRITANHQKILKASSHFRLAAFRFLINKN
jgi:hypothetical protein